MKAEPLEDGDGREREEGIPPSEAERADSADDSSVIVADSEVDSPAVDDGEDLSDSLVMMAYPRRVRKPRVPWCVHVTKCWDTSLSVALVEQV